MPKTLFTLGANTLIFNEKKEILLCHRTDKDMWNFPGGGVESGETPEEAAIREVREEIGVEVELYKFLGVYTKPKDNDIVFAFLGKIVKGTPILTDEADDIQYFSTDNLPANFNPKQAERVRDALKYLPEVIFKKQID
jgi:mutator protein MutT